MNRHRFRLPVVALLVASIFILADLIVVPVLTERGPACERVNAWASSQKSLPSTLTEISAYPMSYRRVIFGKLPPATRAAIVREHLTSFLNQNWLTSAQKAVLQEAISEVRPEDYTNPANESKATRLEQKVSSVFAQKERAQIFYRIGPERPSYRGAKALLIGVQESLRGMLVANAQQTLCECRVDDDCARRGGGFCNYTTSCQATGGGCGYNFMLVCARLCT